ncbi:hypothetical protein [Catenuloplanes japonicus]|uniref:hypothetical protein n=1 Tax=Catenuloplanes japonicus TaxID=33876 RepID=UPI000526F088|nr:hypothetical protein [Catenuloplanes japonicus]
MADIEVDLTAIARLRAAAGRVSSGMSSLSPRVTAASELPDGAFGHLPFISDFLRGKYAEVSGGATTMFRAGTDAFDRIGGALDETVRGYEENESRTGRSFTALETRLPR